MTSKFTAFALALGLGLAVAAPAFAAGAVSTSSQDQNQLNTQPNVQTQAPERVSSQPNSQQYNAAGESITAQEHFSTDGVNYNTP